MVDPANEGAPHAGVVPAHGDVVIWADGTGTFTYASPSVVDALGWTPEEMVGKSAVDFWPPEQMSTNARMFAELLETGFTRIRDQFATADGPRRWFDLSAVLIRDPAGQPESIVCVMRDAEEDVAAHAAARLGANLGTLMDAVTDPVALLDPIRDEAGTITDFTVVATNNSLAAGLSLDADVLSGVRLSDLDRDGGDLVGIVAPWMEGGVPVALDGVPRWLPALRATHYFDVRANPSHDLLAVSFRDVTDRARAAEDLARSEEMFRAAMKSSAVGTGIHREGKIIEVNAALCQILGRKERDLVGIDVRELVRVQDLDYILHLDAQLAAGTQAPDPVKLSIRRPDGSQVWLRISVSALPPDRDGKRRTLVHVIDRTAEQHARTELEYQALHDPLTGLHNRAWVMDMLTSELAAADRGSGSVAVLALDLDNFKLVNDSLGHAAGDDVLREVAQWLTASLRPHDHPARLGGDEFVVVATHLDGAAGAEQLASRICAMLNRDLRIGGHQVVVSVSIGVAMAARGAAAEQLLRDADSALFRAKADGRGRWRFFDESMHATAMSRLALESEIADGLVRGQFVPYFQPQVSLETRQVVGYEALARWQHPSRGLVGPGEFLPAAEDTGVVAELGDAILDRVCALLARDPGLRQVSVNQSPVQLSRGDWRSRFIDVVARHGVDPSRLVIEVTESAVLTHLDQVADDLAAMRALGMGVHLDDFGTGYSPLTLLRDLPVTGLKMDRSFTSQLPHDEGARMLAAGLANLAEGLGLETIAEGVETTEEAELLFLLGWSYGQGWLFGRPERDPQRPADLP